MAISCRGVGGSSSKVLPLQPNSYTFYPSEQITSSLLHHFTHCSPLLHGNFSRGRGVNPEKSTDCSPLQPTLTWQFQSGRVVPEKCSHCSPLLLGNFSQGVIPQKSSHFSPLQPTLKWQFQSGGGGNSWKVLPLQPIAAHSYMAILVRGGVIPQKSSHCSPLQPTLTWQF